MGTEFNSDSVGKTESYCVSKMMGFVVIPAGMWELNAIVTVLGRTRYYCVNKMMGFVVIPAGMWELNAIVSVLGRPRVTE